MEVRLTQCLMLAHFMVIGDSQNKGKLYCIWRLLQETLNVLKSSIVTCHVEHKKKAGESNLPGGTEGPAKRLMPEQQGARMGTSWNIAV